MKLNHVAIASTTFIIIIGILLITPFFVRPSPVKKLKIMLSVSIIDPVNVRAWCEDLAALLKENGRSATVFFVGKIAEMSPESVRVFSRDVDIGSATYDCVDLASLRDTGIQLEQVDRGKFAVDAAGNLFSKLFKSPYGSTDLNIYSLLRTCGIVSDFSYDSYYNIRVDDSFIKYSCSAYSGYEHSADFFMALPKTESPIILNFNNTLAVSHIIELVSQIQSHDIEFVNASQLTGLSLTERR